MTRNRLLGQAVCIPWFVGVLPARNQKCPDDAPPELKNAMALRNTGTIARRCSCGGTGETVKVDRRFSEIAFVHTDGSAAADSNIRRLLAQGA
jgi:hypothetical protein